MSTFLQVSPSRQLAMDIQADIDALKSYATAALGRIYKMANTPDEQQAILDKFGTNAASALAAYATFQGAMEVIAPGAVPVASPAIFVAQPDGTVLYVAPPQPPLPPAP